MIKYNQDIIDFIRESCQFDSSINDFEIFEHFKDSLLYAKLNLNFEFKKLKEKIIKVLFT